MLKKFNNLTKNLNDLTLERTNEILDILRKLNFDVNETPLTYENKIEILKELRNKVSITFVYELKLDSIDLTIEELIKEIDFTKHKFQKFSPDTGTFAYMLDNDYTDEKDNTFKVINSSRGILYAYLIVMLYDKISN